MGYALVVLGIAALVRLRAPLVPREIARGVYVMAGLSLVARLFWVAPAFIHDGFHGPLIVNGVLDFPRPPGPGTYGGGYGPGSFTVLGLLSFLLGRSAEGVFRANVLVSALATIPLAGAAVQLTKRPRAGLYAAALWAGSPLVARLACSEDAHIVGIAFALAGIAWAESAVWAAVIATALAVFTRQTFIPFALLAGAMLVERKWRGEAVAQMRWLLPALLAVLVLRTAATAGSSDGMELMVGLLLVPSHPSWLLGFLGSHPLFSIPRLSPIVLLLLLLGAIEVLRHSKVRISVASIWLILFALSLPPSFPSLGVRWSFRLPVYVLSILIAGGGAAWLESRLGRGRTMLLPAILVGSALGSATLEIHRPNAEFVEYRFLRDSLSQMKRPLVVYAESGPGWRLPTVLAERMRVPIRQSPEPGALFFEGIGCYAWDVPELAGAQKAPAHELPPRAEVQRVLGLMLDPERNYGGDAVPHPEGARADCASRMKGAIPFRTGPGVTLEDSPPTAIFGRRGMTLQFLEWPQ